MPVDAQTRAVLDQLKDVPAFNTLSPAEARRLIEELFRTKGEPEPVGKVENRSIAAPAGNIPIRVFTPKGAGPFPLLVFFHGGGWVLGSLESWDAPCRMLTNQAGCVTVAVDYRLAPEYKFPAAAEDCYAATMRCAPTRSAPARASGRPS